MGLSLEGALGRLSTFGQREGTQLTPQTPPKLKESPRERASLKGDRLVYRDRGKVDFWFVPYGPRVK